MGWLSLSARKLDLKRNISSLTLRDIQISRTIRRTHKQMSYDQSIMNTQKSADLKEIKDRYNEVNNSRPDLNSEEYNQWYLDWQNAKQEYEEEKLRISEYYDQQMAMLEEEATDKETELQEEQTVIETQMEAMRAEIEALDERISQDIESSTIKV